MSTNLDTNEISWINGVKLSAKTQTATWLVAFLLAILGLFSGRITESIRFALNRADLRTTQYEELATEISQYIFSAELCTEFIGSSSTTKETLTELVTEYNVNITKLRKKEFVYSAWIQKFWGKSQADKFEQFMNSVRAYDTAIHSINDELGKISKGEKSTIDPQRSVEVLKQLEPAVKQLREHGHAILASLS